MLKSYKTEILPTAKQTDKIRRSIGICRWLYNEYIARNKRLYKLYQRGYLDKNQKHFISAMDFDKFVNHKLKNREERAWINECGSKARKKSITNAETAFKKFFKGEAGFPRFKKRNRQSVGIYFPKNNKGDWTVKRQWIHIPTIGKVKLNEFGYIPVEATVKSGTVSQKADRFYVSVVVDIPESQYVEPHGEPHGEPLGIDLGLKDLAILSDGTKYKNINKTSSIKKLKKKLKREQRRLSRKLENNKKKRGEKSATYFANISKNVLKVQKLHYRLTSIRTNYTNQVVNEIVKREPSYITIENLNVKGMMKNHHLAKAIAECKFYEFRIKLTAKCHEHNIELRIVDRFYPSSKTCHECGNIKHDLKLSDRTYICPECGNTIDRDYQAALNLRDVKKYKIA